MVVVSKLPKQKKRKWLSRSWTPRIMFAATVVMVLIDGFYRTQGLNMFTPIGDPIAVAVLYAWALIGILGVHEAGHLIAAKWHKIKTTWPYFIPGIPVYGIPTFGAFIQSRSLTVNVPCSISSTSWSCSRRRCSRIVRSPSICSIKCARSSIKSPMSPRTLLVYCSCCNCN